MQAAVMRTVLLLGVSASASALMNAAFAAKSPALRLRANAAQVGGVAEKATEAPAAAKKERLNVRIDDVWYDLTGWRAAHPAGSHWIDAYQNADATEVMHAFHSEHAKAMTERLPRSKSPPEGVAPPVASTYAFRELRQRLEREGWFKISAMGEARKLLPWFVMTAAGISFSRMSGGLAKLGAVLCLGVGNTLAGWLAHDFVHSRSRFAAVMRPFSELIGGMSQTWWSMKHNMHHALTNEIGYDEDVALEPAVYLWRPDPANDSPLRKMQHFYWPLPFSVLFFYWRFDSIKYALQHRKWKQLARLGLHWSAFLSVVPFSTMFLSIWLSGFLTATIVTVTHQSEEIFMRDTSRKYDFVEAQFRSTRDAKLGNPFSDILWGGMQWQLEHHLFPTMPRYRYPALAKELEAFAKEQGLDYRVSGELEIIKQNIDKLAEMAHAEPQPGNPDSTPMYKQI